MRQNEGVSASPPGRTPTAAPPMEALLSFLQRSPSLSRRTLFAGIGTGVLGASLGLPEKVSAEETQDGRRHLRVATFNIHHGADPHDLLDLERVAAVIESMDLDIVGLQEVDRFWPRSNFVDQPQWLGRRLRMWTAYGANLVLPPEDGTDETARRDREYGTLVLSKWPILTKSNVLLPKFPDGEQRGLMKTTIVTPVGPVHFANTHLQHNDPAEREVQADAIVALLGPTPRRTILVGDFNAEAGTPEIDVIDTAVDDVWDAVGDGPGHTYDTIDPTVRIDYVWASADVVPRSAHVVTDDPLASDHLPVVAEYGFRRR